MSTVTVETNNKEQINQTPSREVGYVIGSRNYLAYVDGLPTIRVNDIVESDSGIRGIVNTLSAENIEVLLLDEGAIYPGMPFYTTGKKITVGVGSFLLGRSINPLGLPIDGKGILGKTSTKEESDLEHQAAGINAREFITTQLMTGITLIDSLVPIGKGQRELILGDNHSGVGSFLVDLIVNQKDSSMICVYAAIGKPASFIKSLINTLQINNALANTIIVATSSTEPTPLIFLTPKSALSIAEYFQQKGKDVLLILDDMGIHAKTYREISLLAGKSPGRESYPGDIFFTHARLLERAGKFNPTAGDGSITALPVMELQLTDFTGFIPTNLMSITDGHLLFKSNLYNKNQRPAIDIALSVSRVGRQTQHIVNNALSRRVRQVLAKAQDLETIARFSTELPPETQLILRQQILIEEILKQDDLTAIPLNIQSILLALIFSTYLNDKNEAFIKKNKSILVTAFTQDPSLTPITQAVQNLKSDTELIAMLEKITPKLIEICKY